MTKQIEDYINKSLTNESKATALELIAFLRKNNIKFYKDNDFCRKDKICYHLKFNNECIALISIKEPDKTWTIWLNNLKFFNKDNIDNKIKNITWQNTTFCYHFCDGRNKKNIFGKNFDEVYGCALRIDNPDINDLLFLKKIIELYKEYIIYNNVINHYDLLIDENNDPVRDPKPLHDYMDKWDGQDFIRRMKLNKEKSVLEIGVGTGRLAIRVAPLCGQFYGIDISPKTIERAKENLINQTNVTLYCEDFLIKKFEHRYDVIYSSLTFMHIKNKKSAINKIADLLNDGGRFVLSINKNQEKIFNMGSRKIFIFPDTCSEIEICIFNSGLILMEHYETEFAHIFVAKKDCTYHCD